MGLFNFMQELAMDLGTANTVITCDGKIVVDEPSMVAIDLRTGKVDAIGKKAYQMADKTNKYQTTVKPLRDGVIADFDAAEMMIRGFIKMAPHKNRLFTSSLRLVIGIPLGSTEVEMRAVRDSAEHAGGRDVYMIFEPMAAALGIGLDVEAPCGNMVVDIGGGTSEIAVISLGGVVTGDSLRTAGNDFNHDIMDYMREQHNIRIGEPTAERIKKSVGSALRDLGDGAPDPFIVTGPNYSTGMPMHVQVTYQEIAHCLDRSIEKIENKILDTLTKTPPELYADIVTQGIYLSGGGALLKGLAQRLTEKIQIEFKVADDPLHAVARGTGLALKNVEKYKFLLR